MLWMRSGASMAKTAEEIVMDLAYIGLALVFALLTFLLIEGCSRLGSKS